MRPRILWRLGLADAITVANAVLGFLAVIAATIDPRLAARLILLAAMGDGLDGVVARRFGGSPVGEYLDSLSDVAAFGVAPGLLVYSTISGTQPPPPALPTLLWGLTIVVAAAFLAAVVIRLAFYTANDTHGPLTTGVPSTLAATILAATVLAGIGTAAALVIGTGLLSVLMVLDIQYPDLLARDTFIMGVVQGLAVLVPDALGRAFPYALLTLALAYLVLAPRFYWRDTPAT